ncbi:MAG: hypothetical protein R3258_06235 [Acidimicrobiia bacterium]|nr:hypothetical protein [Acidimicrobiia bacterium]
MADETHETRRIGGAADVSEVYERFGKSDFLASLFGMFAGLGVLVFLSALIAAGAAGIDYQLNQINAEGLLEEASVVGLSVAALVVFFAFLAGGFAAGRMARYSGGLNGLGSGLWLLLLVAVFAGLGAWVGPEYNAFNRTDLPNWFAQIDVDDRTAMAIVGAVVLAGATLLGGYLGGRIGETYHTRVDAALIDSARKEA